MKRILFYPVLALLAIALSQLMAVPRRAVALGSNSVTAVDFGAGLDFIATSNGDIYQGIHDQPAGDGTSWTLVGNVGSASPIVQIQDLFSDAGHEYVWAYAEDGGLFVSSDNGHTWVLKGNVFATTTVRDGTWGSIKKRYR